MMKTNGIQRMRSAEKLAFLNDLFSRDNFMIITHKNPDGDTLGSAFALQKVLLDMGKRVFVACSDPVPSRFRFITDGTEELGVKFEPDCVVAVDTATTELIGQAFAGFAGRVDFCIDHHHTNTAYAKQTLVSAKSSSVGEFLFDLFRLAKIRPDQYIAEKLYAAISFDTGCFRYANVTPHTHYVAGRLLNYKFDFEAVNRRLFDIASLEQLKVETAVISAVERYKNNTVTLLTLTQDMLKNLGCENVDIDGLSAVTRRIEGTVIGITMREADDGKIKVSLRSLDDCVDVSKIAAVFGGGGHKRASGCVFDCPIAEAKNALLGAVFEEWDRIFSE